MGVLMRDGFSARGLRPATGCGLPQPSGEILLLISLQMQRRAIADAICDCG
jgi:hypothetical protein